MTLIRLQKLLYKAQAWHLSWHEQPLFDSVIEAWVDGPVGKDVYSAHRGDYIVSSLILGDAERVDLVARGTIRAVIDRYGKLSGDELSAITHAETPWVDARAGLSPNQTGTGHHP